MKMKRAVLYYLRFFARLSLSIYKPKVIGITGSVGKSSTRNAVYAMMKDYFRVRAIKEGNSETGIPLGILGINPGHYRLPDWLRIMATAPFKLNNIKNVDYLIVEMGIDSPFSPKNMDYLLTIVKPDVAVVLNVHPVHTMQFDQLLDPGLGGEKRLEFIIKRITKEKLKIITMARPKIGIINESLMLRPAQGSATELVEFGKNDKTDIKFLSYEVDLKKTSFKYLLTKTNDAIEIIVNGFVLPRGYQEVFAAAIAVGKSLSMENDRIRSGISKNFSLPAGRGSILKGINSSIVIDSSYNASKASVFTYLELAKGISEKEKRPLVLVLGDMRELGEETKTEHEQVAEKISALGADRLYCLGPNTKKYIIPKLKEKIKEVRGFNTALEAGDYLLKSLPYRSIVLVKGSQNEIFLEEAVKKILKDKTDQKKLCRQNDFWIKRKKRFFQGK